MGNPLQVDRSTPAEALPPQTSGADVCGISADIESKRVLKLHYKHEVTDANRKAIVDAFNALNRERSALAKPASKPAGGGVTIEAIARAICKGRGLNPEVQNQGPARDGTVDGHWDINSPFGRPYDNRWHYGWRNQVEAAKAVAELLALSSPASSSPAEVD